MSSSTYTFWCNAAGCAKCVLGIAAHKERTFGLYLYVTYWLPRFSALYAPLFCLTLLLHTLFAYRACISYGAMLAKVHSNFQLRLALHNHVQAFLFCTEAIVFRQCFVIMPTASKVAAALSVCGTLASVIFYY